VDEATTGTGGACGGMYLDVLFEDFLCTKLDVRSKEKYYRALRSAVGMFNTQIKIGFNPFDPNCPETYELILPGLPDIPSAGLEGGFLTVSRYQ
jgi:hypothetical protein